MKRLSSQRGGWSHRQLAQLAGLRYTSDAEAGYSRVRNGHGFTFLNARGKPLRNRRELNRIEHLAIPPAWTKVWICRFAGGHLQATGRDERKRKQYLYHERWREVANLAKFIHIVNFGRQIAKLRRKIAGDLRGQRLTRKRVLAGMIALLDATSIRVGNEEYTRSNGSYGLTTLRTRHVHVAGRAAELHFRAKGGIHRDVVIEDSRLVRMLKQLKELPGAHVFQYLDDENGIHTVTSADVNDYLREVTGQPFTAKDFRTWKASALVAGMFLRAPAVTAVKERKRVIKSSLAAAAELLANTATVCRKYYIHSALLDAYERGTFRGYFGRTLFGRKGRSIDDEQLLTRFLRQWKPTYPREPKATKTFPSD